MKASAIYLIPFVCNSLRQFVVPVYQRPYSWTVKQCAQLFDDLESLLSEGRSSHFFGSLVIKDNSNGPFIESEVIDGQQRLTTVSLLLLTLRNLLKQGVLNAPDKQEIIENIGKFFYFPNDVQVPKDTLRLCLGVADRPHWMNLLGLGGEPAPTSPLAQNQAFFAERLCRSPFSPSQLYEAIRKLEVICVTLGGGDDPQLIFESLNATGLALTEGDKVRNFLLMSLPPHEQERLHARHWTAIERYTKGAVSELIRDFLSIKRQFTPRLDAVYATFKRFTAESGLGREALLQELERYAKWFEQYQACGLREWPSPLRASLYRLRRLDVAALRPFVLEVLRHHEEGMLTVDDLLAIFKVLESYLLRRAICEVPTAALNKLFQTLDKDIAHLSHGDVKYVDVFTYALRAKQGSLRFPGDEEFRTDLAARQVYKMNKAYRNYLFERFENGDYKETQHVYECLDQRDYSIEHIMPQHLTQAWREALGPQCEEIHATWLHRLANLTLTGYNPELSNATFLEKRDYPKGGFHDSNLHLNKTLAVLDHWDESTLQAREKELCDRALELWPLPETDFHPIERQWDTCSLADETLSLTNRKPARYRFYGDDFAVKDWTAVFVGVMRALLDKHRTALHALVESTEDHGFAWLSRIPNEFRAPEKLEEGLFLEKHGSTDQRLSCLRALFEHLEEDSDSLVFYLQNSAHATGDQKPFEQECYAYWAFALPTLQAQCPWLSNRNPTYNSHFMTRRPGVRGYELHYVATVSSAKVLLTIWMKTAADNKAAFDRLIPHRQAIEEAFGTQLVWERYNQGRSAWIEYKQTGLNVRNHDDWPRIRAFHEQWGKRLWEAVLPFIPHT